MYGINHKINDPGLYLLSDIVEEQLNVYVKALADTPAEDKEKSLNWNMPFRYTRANWTNSNRKLRIRKRNGFNSLLKRFMPCMVNTNGNLSVLSFTNTVNQRRNTVVIFRALYCMERQNVKRWSMSFNQGMYPNKWPCKI